MSNFRIISVRNYYTHLTIIGVLLFLILAVLVKRSEPTVQKQFPGFAKAKNPHVCFDQTHESCDGNCECDGLGCNESVYNNISFANDKPNDYKNLDPYELGKDYQILMEQNGCSIWDGKRYVGYLRYHENCDFHRLINKDNH